MRGIIWVVLLISFLASGCEAWAGKPSDNPSTTPAVKTEKVIGLPVDGQSTSKPPPTVAELADDSPKVNKATVLPDARVVELPTETLPLWRRFAGQKPALVLLANDPFLQPIPETLSAQAIGLVQHGSQEELRQKATSRTAAPLLLPSMTLSAALKAGLFSRVVWVIPTQVAADQFNLEHFRRQLRNIGAIDEKEGESFKLENGLFTGKLRGILFQAAHRNAVPTLSEPVVLHLDLSFFPPLYQDEIKTPLFTLLAQTFSGLNKISGQVVSLTISLSNLDGSIPLASRFVGHDLATLFRNPSLLGKPLPENWSRRADALYLESFFQKEKVRELYLEMEKAAPHDPSVKYALYQMARQFNEGDKAMTYLREAVHLDPVYAMEYLTLADLAEEKQLSAQALQMLALARETFPDNPFILLREAELLLSVGRLEEAEGLVHHLQSLTWSPVYYTDVPPLLEELSRAARRKE